MVNGRLIDIPNNVEVRIGVISTGQPEMEDL